MPRRNCSALTWVEVIVALAVVCVLVALTLPSITSSHHLPGMQTLSNMRQLHLATQTMALDGTTTGETNLNWPGNTGGTYSNWMISLVPAYLSTNDFCKLMSAPQVSVFPNSYPPAMKDTALLVYAVRNEDGTNAVFLTTANFTNTPSGGMPLNSRAKPFGNTRFVVFRKGGDGVVLQPKDAGNTNRVGFYVPLCR